MPPDRPIKLQLHAASSKKDRSTPRGIVDIFYDSVLHLIRSNLGYSPRFRSHSAGDTQLIILKTLAVGGKLLLSHPRRYLLHRHLLHG